MKNQKRNNKRIINQVNNRTFIQALAIVTLVTGMASCSNTKYLPAGESLYLGATVKVDGPTVSRKERKVLTTDLEALTRPRPNRKMLGMRIRLLAYNLAGNPKKETGLRGKLKYKFGEAPVVLSSVSMTRNAEILANTLDNRGYFRSTVTADTIVKRRKARMIYTVNAAPQYTINKVAFEVDSSSFIGSSILSTVPTTLLQPGRPFNLEMIKDERTRIDGVLKENGFYFFSPDFLLIDADSTIGDHKVNLFVMLKQATPKNAKELYTIKDIYLYSNYRLNVAGDDTSKKNAVFYNGFYVYDRQKKYKPKLFLQSMQFDQGDVYNRTDHNLSLNRLVTMGVFKFVKNRFEVADGPFSQLNAFYYLTPYPKKSLRLEVTGTTKSNNLAGGQLTLAWRNRNTFRAGELFTVSASGGAEVQYSAAQKGYNVYRAGLEASMSFPRFLIPFVQINKKGGFVPKTTVTLAYDILNKQKLYTMNSFRASYGYSWKESLKKEHTFNPIAVNYVQPVSVSNEYAAAADTNANLKKVIEKQFILGSNYNWTYNGLAEGRNIDALYFSGTVDLGGNLAGLIKGGGNPSNPSKIFGKEFSQYLKAEGDFRVYRRAGDNSTWANRIILGVGYPYGNSRELPYVKQFFIGGNNSLRAFRTRALGPGTYIGNDSLIADQSGDIKLELNTEFRTKIYSIFHAAAFIDAGNIWLYRDNPNKPGAAISKDWFKELAVGAGIGLRVDVSILILRLDVAFPLRKPWYPEKERWVIDQIQFGSAAWRRENLIYNIAIGYPF
ncbi:BamA/TamA family outer membrane protein [Pseudoflavitalea rhizosphaerae]|uniref:translocation and assembly module lipoprotein TamL n=1 Tax=Pseudoflavitalea rhizosphaerae TaxID=1884793 RepID=UPI001F49CBB2|nr:BamA/TamA family outer membrane protein [Pseudoflavitalea rhizosphaerae]